MTQKSVEPDNITLDDCITPEEFKTLLSRGLGEKHTRFEPIAHEWRCKRCVSPMEIKKISHAVLLDDGPSRDKTDITWYFASCGNLSCFYYRPSQRKGAPISLREIQNPYEKHSELKSLYRSARAERFHIKSLR